jgi:hypothetical protein
MCAFFISSLSCTMFLCFFYIYQHQQFFSYLVAVTITGFRAANLDICSALVAFSSEGSFTCHIYCDTASVYTVSSEGLAPTSHSGIPTRDVRTILCRCCNQCEHVQCEFSQFFFLWQSLYTGVTLIGNAMVIIGNGTVHADAVVASFRVCMSVT